MTEKQSCRDTQGTSSQEDRGRDCSDVGQAKEQPPETRKEQARAGPQILQREHGLMERLDFGLLDSRIMNKHTSNE